ncbi:MAG: helix-turn-helix transcriptional regulator [Gemmataceae bacterium]
MNGSVSSNSLDLCGKIARLVEERGWNQEDFARIAHINRHTARTIMQGNHRLRNVTVSRCAKALGLPVIDLRTLPLEQLLPRLRDGATSDEEVLRQRLDQATQPELISWLERNPERAARLTDEDMDELFSLQGTGGPLTRMGVEHFVSLIERKRRLIEKVHAVANTEYIELLEQMVQLMYEKIQPYADRQ